MIIEKILFKYFAKYLNRICGDACVYIGACYDVALSAGHERTLFLLPD